MISDPVGDMIARIKNAQMAGHKTVTIPFSNHKKQILDLIQKEGYIAKVNTDEEDGHQVLKVKLKYDQDQGYITHIARVSKPGLRIYKSSGELRKPLNGYGVGIISTSKGVMSVLEAKKQGIGGELICELW